MNKITGQLCLCSTSAQACDFYRDLAARKDQAWKFQIRWSVLRFAIILLSVQATHALAADLKISWNPVQQDVTGAHETISHYLLYFGHTPRPSMVTHPGDGTFSYDKILNAGHATQHIVSGLRPGTWFFTVSAVDSDGNISQYSRQIKFELPDKNGKVPPPISKANKPITSKPTKNPSGSGCTTNQAHSTKNPAIVLLLFWIAIRPARKKETRPGDRHQATNLLA